MTYGRPFVALLIAMLSAPAFAEPPDPAARRATPPRVSYADGDVSFWREGAEDWSPARRNTPLAEGDALYAGPGANLEVEFGPGAFVRIGDDTDLGLERVEREHLQLRVKGGHAVVDVRSLPRGRRVEINTPVAAFTIDEKGSYRTDIGPDRTRFVVRNGGAAVASLPGGETIEVESGSELVFEGSDDQRPSLIRAAGLDDWDRWNEERGGRVARRPVSREYLPEDVYGGEDLDEHGTWDEEPRYGRIWRPTYVTPGWAPYTTGRWVWDPYYGWTWIDDAPWGWAPFHYGRWVFVGGAWGWAPGPIIARPVYSPALVAFFGSPGVSVSVSVGGPTVGWVALGWGEPVIPWWGHSGFVGVPCWWGWGGPRVVNNIIVQRNTYIHARNVTVYQNQHVHNAFVATSREHFGRGKWERLSGPRAERQALRPVHGRLDVRPSSEAFSPAAGKGRRPPEWSQSRGVVATRARRPGAEQGPAARGPDGGGSQVPAPRIVPAPKRRAPGRGGGTGEWTNEGRRGGNGGGAESTLPPPRPTRRPPAAGSGALDPQRPAPEAPRSGRPTGGWRKESGGESGNVAPPAPRPQAPRRTAPRREVPRGDREGGWQSGDTVSPPPPRRPRQSGAPATVPPPLRPQAPRAVEPRQGNGNGRGGAWQRQSPERRERQPGAAPSRETPQGGWQQMRRKADGARLAVREDEPAARRQRRQD